ncbi:hypothetical protein KC19_12G029400 [Ceratodon purpureus]|uniref:Exostosin GT47 domain-containing protein n=1 Tax=Ceratodon purpureus TaxID=3225 RepID=A0A8T0G428_CERPU|nr:hypothetical protein KC19_12G029400 [Ceratodon purpureus]
MVWFKWRATDYRILSSNGTATTPEYSFLVSLHAFSMKHSETPFINSGVSPASKADDGERFNWFVMSDTAAPARLNVYVYEMPAKCTTDLLWLFQNSQEQTVNLTSSGSPVHRLIHQHSVDFWLYSNLMALEDKRLVRSVRRVSNQAQADVFYIPFFTTIPFFLLSRSQSKLLYKKCALRTGGRKLDNSATSMAEVRWTGPCTPSASSLVDEISSPVLKSCHLVAS